LLQGGARHELHDQEEQVVRLAEVDDAHGVAVGQLRDDLRFLEEAGLVLGLARRQPSPGCPGLAFGTVARWAISFGID
ncbi:MAG: hypothetical protein MJK04_29650, partial [Psychrosphaera sp.]|nr:hypothetical protein [Psychrosphaera sp.]